MSPGTARLARIAREHGWLWRGAVAPLGLILVLWLAVGFYLKENREAAERAAQVESENLARSLEQTTIRMAEAADQLLRFVQLGYRLDPQRFDLLAWADAYRPADGLSVQLALIGRDGRLRASSVDPNAAPVDLSDRPHFQFHAAGGPEQLYISRPVFGRVSGRWTIQFTRPLRDASGAFDGVAVLSLDTGYLQNYLDALRIGHATLALVGRDGVVRVRAPEPQEPGARLDAETMDRLRATGAGGFREWDHVAAVERLVSFRAVQGYPLIVLAGLDLAEAAAAHAQTREYMLTGGAAATLLILLAGILLQFQRRRIAETTHALEVTLDRMTQGVVMAAPSGRVVVMNDRARDLLDLRRRDAAPGMPVVDLLARLGAPAEGGHPGLRERVTADGRTVASELLPLPGGGLVLTSTDVTAERAAAAAQAAARQAAEEANRAKSDFLANMSHEIRTPMNGVIGMLQVLRHSGLDPDQKRMAETISRSANALLTVLNDILDYSKLEAGRITLEPQPCNIAELVEDVGGLMRGAAEGKGVSLTVDVLAKPPTVLVDPVRLRQVLLNFLSNAVKFSDVGEIRVTLDSAPDPEDPARAVVTIAVKDQGIGIAPEALSRLFTRFTQVDGSSTRRFGGTGLGLVISRELAQLMGGAISVRSRPEEGSEFTVRLPLPVTDAAPAAASEEEDESPPGPCRQLDILVAEDDEVNRIVISAFLQPHGHRVTFAYNGVDAVLAMRKARFDVILMDVMMPGMDGPEATRRIRDLPGAAAVTPIVALTANAMAGDRERYLAAGMNAYVSKPINRRELYRTIERLLGIRAFRRDKAAAAVVPEPGPEAASPALHDELDALLGGLDGIGGGPAARS